MSAFGYQIIQTLVTDIEPDHKVGIFYDNVGYGVQILENFPFKLSSALTCNDCFAGQGSHE